MKNIDWQTAGSIATTLGLIVALLALAYQLNESRKSSDFIAFTKYQEAYDKISKKRIDTFQMIKKEVRSNPKTKHEIPDKSDTFYYLNIRVKQKEPLYAIEQGLIEEEVHALNILNELCKYALKDENKLSMVKILYSNDISFYQNNLKELQNFRDLCAKERLMPKLMHAHLTKIKIRDNFGK